MAIAERILAVMLIVYVAAWLWLFLKTWDSI